MRNFLAALALTPVLLLSGCGPQGSLPSNGLLLQVQAAMVNACGFLPAPLTMAAEIIAHYNLVVGASAEVVAQAVTAACNVLPKPAQNMAGPEEGGTILNDIHVDGNWVTPPKER